MPIDLYHSQLGPNSIKVMNYVRQNNLETFIHTINVDEDPEAGETQTPCLVVEGKPILDSSEIIKWLQKNIHAFQRSESEPYGDGANVTHYLGNDEYSERNMVKDAFGSGPKNDIDKTGQVAYGNLTPRP